MFAVAALASCGSDKGAEGGGPKGPTDPSGDGYMTISVVTPTKERSRSGSSENTGKAEEAKIDKIYAVTFGGTQKVVKASDPVPAAQLLDMNGSQDTPKAIKVSSATKYLLLVANPGPKLEAVLTGISAGDSWANINKAISAVPAGYTIATDKTDVFVEEIRQIKTGAKNDANVEYEKFAMINSGSIDDPSNGLFLVDATKIKGIDDYDTEAEAEEAANNEANKQKVIIERLAAKIQVNVPTTPGAVDVLPAGAAFTFLDKWTLDVVNSKFFPYAVKKESSSGNHTGTVYDNNFYTIDPNFEDDLATPLPTDEAIAGLYYNQKINRVPNVTWMKNNQYDYAIENTMAKMEQQYKNATRIVLQATYYPDQNWTGDWFAWTTLSDGTQTWETFADLASDYSAAEVKELDGTADNKEKAFLAACRSFYKKVTDEYPAIASAAADFPALDGKLGGVANGGELLKGDNCIKWYQNGLNYYYYEIVHDNTLDVKNAFGKYGIVRNNWYQLKLTKVNGPGKPWYPTVDPKDPDPDGPEPPDPIDEFEGYLSFEIGVGPWISWETGFEIGR